MLLYKALCNMFYILFIFGVFFYSVDADLVVQTKYGKVRGTTFDTNHGRTFYAWKGIPYAKPPIGNLRFLDPVKPEPWSDILNASECSSACIYFGRPNDTPTKGHSENCLYLNVYSPAKVGSNSSLPVMVWIHGGAFVIGNGEFAFFDPSPLLSEDVMVVTLNYRLGVLGFLSTGDDVILGNAGLKDQVLALQWVKENIASFGGNPEKITIFGQSAGGASVGYHLVSPMSRGLFSSAILQSGSALLPFKMENSSKDFAYSIASQVDSSITNKSTSDQVKDVLQKTDLDVLLNITMAIRAGGQPVLEVKTNSSFLTDPLFEAVEAGNIARVPVLIGHTSEESISPELDMASLLKTAKQYDSQPELVVPETMHVKSNVSKKTVGKEIQEEFAKNGLFVNNASRVLRLKSATFERSSLKQALLQYKFTPVYMYQFSYCGTVCQTNNPNIPGAGRVGHSQENPYLFNMTTRNILKTDEEYLTRYRIVKLWTNFVKFSNPTPNDDSAELLQNLKLEAVNDKNVSYIDIDKDLSIKPIDLKRAAFWDHIWETYSYRPYGTF